jgi:ribonuclease HI
MKFYAVRRGRSTGVFESWDACRKQVHKFPGAEYKAFPTREEAFSFLSRAEKPLNKTKETSALSSDSQIAIWVDGSCFPQADGSLRIGWGLLVKRDNEEVYRAKGNDIPPEAHRHRNVAGEIFGILKALEWCQAQGITEVALNFDYQGLESWATGVWRAKFPFTQHYSRTVKASNITIHWIKVKAHSGNPENEIVDQLAKEGAMSQKVENERK